MREFDAYGCSLSGVSLIEASAGSGKTYNIQILLLRMLLEMATPIEKILIVTFTKAATAELRERTRKILREMLDCCEGVASTERTKRMLGNLEALPADSPFCKAMRPDEDMATCGVRLLRQAIRDLDRAAILTIHGFCKRMLDENAFASGMLYDLELRSDITELRRQYLFDYYRRETYNADAEKLKRLKSLKFSLKMLRKKLANAFSAGNFCRIIWPEEIDSGENQELNMLLRGAFDYVQDKIAAAKAQDNFMTYDDILLSLERNLYAPNGNELKKSIQQKYCYAMIDEFQDTDEAQFRIFNKLFGENNEGDSGRGFFMIGDPKQAIYGFRGSDIFSYLAARNGVDEERIYYLPDNYRSSTAYIESLNQLYAQMEQPFEQEDIEFIKISAPEAAAGKKLLQNGVEVQNPLKLCRTEKSAVDFAVQEVSRFLDGSYQIMDDGENLRSVRLSDIAVLVRANNTGKEIHHKLTAMQIPSVCSGMDSIFDSEESRELLELGRSIAEPGNRDMLLKVLASSLINFTFAELEKLCQTGDIAIWQQRWYELLRVWENESFLAMFRIFMEFPEFVTTMKHNKKRERKLANLLHLSELLNGIAQDKRLAPMGLLRFLEQQLDEEMRENDEDEKYLPKLPSEREVVTICTIHKSKGLEYPLVILPDMTRKNIISTFFHDEEGRKSLNMRGDELGKKAGKLESWQELLRLFYVGVTRAIYGCTFISVKSKKETTPDLFYRKIGEGRFSHDESLGCPGRIAGKIPEKIVSLEFKGLMRPGYQGTSFSAIAPGGHHSNDSVRTADYDDMDKADTVELLQGELPPIFQVPSGIRTGLCWHRIFELLHFNASREVIVQTAEREIANYGLGGDMEGRDKRLAAVTQMICDVLSAKLVAGNESFSLCDIPALDRMNELEFSYKVKRDFGSGRLNGFFAGDFFQRGEEKFYPAGSAMNGAIDLLFRYGGKYYLLDWKSNRIDNDFANFYTEGMEREIDRNHYHLQYYIYTVALLKYLRSRGENVDENFYRDRFGGVFYLFLRGIAAEAPGRGIYFVKPDYRSVVAMEEILG